MFCPECGRQSPDDVRFCPYCGIDLDDASELLSAEGGPRTPVVGQPVAAQPQTHPQTHPQPQPQVAPVVGPPSRKTPWKLISGIVLALVVVAALGTAIWLTLFRDDDNPKPTSTPGAETTQTVVTTGTTPPGTPGAADQDLRLVLVDGLYGYVNADGRMVLEPQWEAAYDFSEGLAPVLVGDAYGYIDVTGQWAIEPRFWVASPFSEGLAACMDTNELYGYIDATGEWVIDPSFGSAGAFSEGLAPASDAGTYGYIDTSGQWVIEPQYAYADTFAEGLGPVSLLPSGAGFVDRTGAIALQVDADTVWAFSEGLAAAQKGDATGYIDATGQWVIEPQFAMGFNFHDGLAPVLTMMNDYGYIDRRGNIVIGPGYAEAWEFRNGVAGVVPEFGTIVLIDTSGRTVWEP